MAIEFCSENSNMSPRISFSHDLCQSDIVPVEKRPVRSKSSRQNSSIDFDFGVGESSDQESCSADELFFDGKILPTQIKKKIQPTKQSEHSLPPLPLPLPPRLDDADTNEDQKIDRPKQSKIMRDETGDNIDEKQSSKSFWRFKRSSSLNCSNGYGRSLCPLPLLSRSNSTGSTPSIKRTSLTKDNNHNQKQNLHKQVPTKSLHSSSTNHQKPPLKKNYGNGVRVNPILNVPSGNLFGLGSIFSTSTKDKNKKR
ncbi:uncharacterized protein LOC110807513 [Carica papaya]|uniref:uncharacterized protein LOC110807513 n=1 Tax=Carica papaya TaxID=3649 RepID=UPI000B8C9CE4|nr:uncharacterized protein LOC110807513 [Carica papaya]XP_021888348.1 uncharacterized protein LOC110807513 [Carica papaya]